MNELVTYPSGGPGKNAVSDAGAWAQGGWVEVINGTTGNPETRPFILKSLNIESLSVESVYELVFYAGEVGSEEQIFTAKFGAAMLPFSPPLQSGRVFPAGTRITVRMMDSLGSGSVFFSIQYEADPGNVRAS